MSTTLQGSETCLADFLIHNAEKHHQSSALLLGESFSIGEVNWSQLFRWAARLADRLKKLACGELPLIHQVTNTPSDVVVALACGLGGIVEVPIDAAAGDLYHQSCLNQIGGFQLDQQLKRAL